MCDYKVGKEGCSEGSQVSSTSTKTSTYFNQQNQSEDSQSSTDFELPAPELRLCCGCVVGVCSVGRDQYCVGIVCPPLSFDVIFILENKNNIENNENIHN